MLSDRGENGMRRGRRRVRGRFLEQSGRKVFFRDHFFRDHYDKKDGMTFTKSLPKTIASAVRKKDDKIEMLAHERNFLWNLRRTTGLEIARAKDEVKTMITDMKIKYKGFLLFLNKGWFWKGSCLFGFSGD